MATSRTGLGAALVIVVVVTAAFAGCIGPTDDASATQSVDDAAVEAPANTSIPGPFTLRNCDEQFGLFSISAGEAEPYLPEGFELAGFFGTPLPEGTAHLVILTYTCEEDGSTVTEFSADLIVEPPKELRNDDAGDHYVNVMGVTTSASTLEAFRAWGLTSMQEGDVTLEHTMDTPLGMTWGSEASHGTAEARMTTATQGPPADLDGGEVRIFGVEDATVTGAVDVTWTGTVGAFGETVLESNGLVPLANDEVGVGGAFLGFDETFTPVELPP